MADRADPAAAVAIESLWPGALPVERLADVTPVRGRVPDTALRAVVDWTARHPHLADLAVRDAPRPSGKAGIYSLLAGIAETVADDHGLAQPAWTASVPPAPPEATGAVRPENARWNDVPPALAARGLGFPRGHVLAAVVTLLARDAILAEVADELPAHAQETVVIVGGSMLTCGFLPTGPKAPQPGTTVRIRTRSVLAPVKPR